MKKARWVSAAAGAAMVAGTFALPGAGVAYASGNGNVTGNGNVSLLSGNTINAPISLPVNLCGVSLAVLGFSNSGCEGGASSSVITQPSGGGSGDGNGNGNVVGNGNVGVGSGNTVTAPISAPVNVCGVSGAVGGFANSDCRGGAHSHVTLPAGGGDGNGNGNVTGIGNISVVSGNTITAPISAPVNLCGISLALLGFSNSGCEGGATTNVSGGAPGNNGNVTGIGNVGVGSGNTITAPISAPVNVCGVSAAVAGFANSGCRGGAEVNPLTCEGDRCAPPGGCQASCTPPGGCQASCTPPGGCQANCVPPATPPHGGTGPGGGVTAVTSATSPSATSPSGSLPTTGADLLLLGVAAVGTVGVGAGTVVLARRRRNGEAS